MAGLNIPHRSELPHGTFLGDLNRARLDAQQKATDIGNEAVGIGADLMLGEDTGDDMLTDLAYGAVPGGSLYQRAKTGTRPGALDFADFIPGGGTALTAAKMFVPMDLVRSLAKRAGAKGFERTFKSLPEAVQESWISSFGDLHSNKLKKHRDELGVSGQSANTLVHSYPKIVTEYDAPVDGYYIPFSYGSRNFGYYRPYIVTTSGKSPYVISDVLNHEGAHLMDNSMGTAGAINRMTSDWPLADPARDWISRNWIKASTIDKYPLLGSKRAMDWQDRTGYFSPLEYAFSKRFPSEASEPAAILADDPHGLKFYREKPSSGIQLRIDNVGLDPNRIDEDIVAQEGLAQFVQSYPYTDIERTPAHRKLVEFAENDPRRSDDFTIDFDRFEDYLSQPVNKGDFDVEFNVIPYLKGFQNK